MESRDYQKGYLQGQLDEAEAAYRNLVSIMDDMIEEPTAFTLEWISELEELLKKHGRCTGMKVWEGTEGHYTYRIEEKGDTFDVTIDFLGNKESMWFKSYSGARAYLKREYHFTGRMKRIS
ncbi:hypothetical protein QYM23_24550 [Bacillus cereus]|uniref:DUF5348 domain-containing protein n=1 Tax=Bacillus cereus TaxID=1396 RepID=A0AAW7NNF7_BACCE|nr:hypothetical protein [Bacillus cereus]MDN4875992.1 hypothetical protein [Bacillus cereus]